MVDKVDQAKNALKKAEAEYDGATEPCHNHKLSRKAKQTVSRFPELRESLDREIKAAGTQEPDELKYVCEKCKGNGIYNFSFEELRNLKCCTCGEKLSVNISSPEDLFDILTYFLDRVCSWRLDAEKRYLSAMAADRKESALGEKTVLEMSIVKAYDDAINICNWLIEGGKMAGPSPETETTPINGLVSIKGWLGKKRPQKRGHGGLDSQVRAAYEKLPPNSPAYAISDWINNRYPNYKPVTTTKIRQTDAWMDQAEARRNKKKRKQL